MQRRKKELERVALDFSRGLYSKELNHELLQRVVVLNISRARLEVDDLLRCLEAAPYLVRLDASQCGLDMLPDADVFRSQHFLKVLLLHKNALTLWSDLKSACQAPALEWLTVFQNPIAGDPTIRSLILQEKPEILAVDHVVVSEPERLGWTENALATRFHARPLDPDYLEARDKPKLTDKGLVRAALKEIRLIESFAVRRSPSRRIQAAWRGLLGRRQAAAEKGRLLRAAQRIQGGARRLLWRRRMVDNVKEFLAEIDEMDLLLDAKEMLRRWALKLIEASVHRWLLRRSLQRMERKAVEIIGRCMRGSLARRRLFYDVAKFRESASFYFPESHSWEFHVLCNMVLRSHGFPTLPAEHRFEDAEVLGIRFPEFDEVPGRQNTLMRFLSLSKRVVVRPLRFGRFSTPWDGPLHCVVDDVPRDVSEGLRKVKRRAHKVNHRCRAAFERSFCPGEHPIRRQEGGVHDCLVLKALLDSEELPEVNPHSRAFFHAFLSEARLLKPKTWHSCWVKSKAEVEPSGLPNYSQTAWLSQRVLKHRMPNAKAALELCFALQSFSKVKLPSVEPVCALYGKAILEGAAATVIQSSWRAHAARRSLGLKTAMLRRRAAIFVQRAWRWGLFKRRIELLAGAVRTAGSVRTSTLYIEERLLNSLNVIATIDRYPSLPESQLAVGFAEAPVLVNRSKTSSTQGRRRSSLCLDRGGLPKWFLQEAPIELVDQASLRPLRGLQGLLLEGLGGPEAFSNLGEDKAFLEVASPMLENFARAVPGSLQKELKHLELSHATIAASGGCLRSAELRFGSVLQARQRAVLLYLCTFNFETHRAVPLLRRNQIYDVQNVYEILRLWELYGLDWPHRSKVGFFLLRQREPKPSEVIYVNGTRHRSAVDFRKDWQAAEDDLKPATADKKEALHRLEDLKLKKRRHDVEEIQAILADATLPQLFEALDKGSLPDDVDLHSVEAWILGNRATFAPDKADKKMLAKRAAAEKLAMKRMLLEAKEANRAERRTDDGADRLKRCREWEARLMRFYATAHEEQLAEEAQCLRATWQGPTRWLITEADSTSRFWQCYEDRDVHNVWMPEAEDVVKEASEASEAGVESKEMPLETLETPLETPLAESCEKVETTVEKESERRAERQRQKEAKEARQQMRQMAATFGSRRCAIESQIRAKDRQACKAERQEHIREKVDKKRKVWAERRDLMEEKNQQSLEHRRRQVDDLRAELQSLMLTRGEKLNEELKIKKASVVEQRVKRLTKASRDRSTSFELPRSLANTHSVCSTFQGSEKWMDFRQTIATCTGSTASRFSEVTDANQSWSSDVKCLPQVDRLAATETAWRREDNAMRVELPKSKPWERRFSSLRPEKWRESKETPRLALSARM